MRVAVVGGGLAGLSAACDLVDMGHAVTLFERRPWCGGKTYSHHDETTGEDVDNGQHVFMACTTAYVDFLRKLGTLKLTRRQKRLRVRIFDAYGRLSELRASGIPAPAHLGGSFAFYRHLSLRQKWLIGQLLLGIYAMSEEDRLACHDTSFGEWLRGSRQDDAMIRDFWDFMLLPTLNCRSDEASAADALFVLRHGFLDTNNASAIGVSGVGLSALHVDPAVDYITARGGCVRTESAVAEIAVVDGNAQGVALRGGSFEAFEGVVCALPAPQAAAVLPEHLHATPLFKALSAIRSNPIINLHCWFDRPVADFPFAAFVGNELQWVFNRDRLDITQRGDRHHLVVSLSGAEPYMGFSKRELEERFVPQLRHALPGARRARLEKFSAIKEPEATFVPSPNLERPGPRTPVSGLVLAGAYTDTGWPATMESAVRSGQSAAQALNVDFQTSQQSLHDRRR